MSEFETLESHIRALRTHVERLVIDPFDLGILLAYSENALTSLARLKAHYDPALSGMAKAPSRHDPEPIVFAPGKQRPARVRKGA
jgi:hypothetical protein